MSYNMTSMWLISIYIYIFCSLYRFKHVNPFSYVFNNGKRLILNNHVLTICKGKLHVDLLEHEGFNVPLYPERLLYVDNDLIVVDKPPNIQTAPGFVTKDSLATQIAESFNLPRVDKMIVHRLDYATSGVLIFARTEFALRALHWQFRTKNRVYKSYIARVAGRLASFEGEVDLPISRDLERGGPYFRIDTVSSDAKPAFSRWHVLNWNHNTTDVRLKPASGRTHQLRLHMAAIGHPIVGDKFYAPPDIFEASGRLMLHAEQLHITHPRTKQAMRFVSRSPFSSFSS